MKTDVTISIKENAAAPGTRRRLHAASSISVGVGVSVPDVEKGNLLVGGTSLSKEAINHELEKLGEEPITEVTSSPVLYSGTSTGNQTDGASEVSETGGSDPTGSIIGGTLGGLVVLVVIMLYVYWLRSPRGKVVDDQPKTCCICSEVKPTGDFGAGENECKTLSADHDELKKSLEKVCKDLNLDLSDCAPRSDSSKFSTGDDKSGIRELIFGLPTYAAEGICSLLCVEDFEVYTNLGRGIDALDEEMENNGTDVDKECYKYVKEEEAGKNNKTFLNNGKDPWKRDCDRNDGTVLPERQVDDPNEPGGKRGMRLDDFANSEMAKTCKLSKPEVLALRFYTTAGFKTINTNLRDETRRERAAKASNAGLKWTIDGASGLKWKNVGATKPTWGRELTNRGLSDALASKTEFKTVQDIEAWKTFNIADLRSTDFIKSGTSYFKPDPEPHPFPVMVFLLWMGVKKLRTFASRSTQAMQ